MTRDEIRAAMFSEESKKPAFKEITLFGSKVHVHQPTLGQMNEVGRLAGNNPKIPAIVRIMIAYTYVPDTNEKVFDDADAEQLATMPTGKWLADFNVAMQELSGVDVKAAEKNSEETA